MSGHFMIPYAYLTDDNLFVDFWTVLISKTAAQLAAEKAEAAPRLQQSAVEVR